jgi:hypothetical protein
MGGIALLLTGSITIVYGDLSRPSASLRYAWAGVLIFMLGFGFVFTTAIVAMIWRSQRLWLYPVLATALFLIHFHFAYPIGGDPPPKGLRELGACIVLACTFAGNLLLRTWVQAGSK